MPNLADSAYEDAGARITVDDANPRFGRRRPHCSQSHSPKRWKRWKVIREGATLVSALFTRPEMKN
jgi:hypothetical protein